MSDSSNVVYILRPYLKVDGGTSLGTCTITTDWALNETTNFYTQNVALSTVTAASNPMVKCTASSDSSEYNRLIAATAYNGGITFVATEKTTRDLTVEIINWTDKLILTNLFVNDFSLGTELDTLTSKINANAAALSKMQKIINTTCTLGTSWTLDSTTGYYTQNVTIEDITAEDQPSLSLVKNGTTAKNDLVLEQQWALITKAETYDGGITFYATSATTATLTVKVSNGITTGGGSNTDSSTGTTDYSQLINKPKINGTELVGDISITTVSGDAANIATNKTNIETNTKEIESLKTSISTKAESGDLDAIRESITANTTQINSNAKNIETNTTNIETNKTSIESIKTDISNKANQSDLDTLNTTVKTNTKSIETNTSDIATNKASIETNTTDIASIKTDVSNKANKTDLDTTNKTVSTNATNIATNTKNISSNTSDISTLKATKAEQSDLDTTNKNVATNTSAIATETTARETADTTLQANIDTLSSKVDTKQDTLISGTNIKTINNQSLLGSGNITIEGGGATNTVVYETVSTLSALPSTGNLNTLYYVEDIKGYYIYTGEVYRSIDATAVQNNLNTLETTVKGKQDKFTVHESQSIEITSWELLSEAPSWCTDDPYMYRAKVSVSNITENTMILNIVLSDSILLNIGQVIETVDGGIYLYAKTDTALSGTLITLITCEVQNA